MIAQTIQLALAPVFVLVALGHILVTLSARLGRIVDRSRDLHGRFVASGGTERDIVMRQMRETDQRISLIGRALRAMVISALGIGLTVSILFLEELAGAVVQDLVNLQNVAGGVFLFSLGWMMWGLLLFLRETRVALNSLKIPQEYFDDRSDA